MMIDRFQAQFDFSEVHSIQLRASAQEAYDGIKEITPSEISRVMRILMWLRTLPERMVGRGAHWLDGEGPMLAQMTAGGFTLLAETAPKEIVLGVILPAKTGRFWRRSSRTDMFHVDAPEFIAFNRPEWVKVVTNLAVEEGDRPDYVTIRTETRCLALSPRARRDFGRYWRLVRPFSGLIRIVWLQGIGRRVARQTALRAGA